jgi:hypothetical protein
MLLTIKSVINVMASISDAEAQKLVNAGVDFGLELNTLLKKQIKKDWPNRKSTKTVNELVQTLKHQCTLQSLLDARNGNKAAQYPSFAERLVKLKKAKDDGELDEEGFNVAMETFMAGVATFYTEGYESTLSSNLIFDKDGRAIGVNPNDRNRFQACHAQLVKEKQDRDNVERARHPSEQSDASASASWYEPTSLLPPSPPLSKEAEEKIAETKAKVRAQTKSAGKRKKKNRKTKRRSRR